MYIDYSSDILITSYGILVHDFPNTYAILGPV